MHARANSENTVWTAPADHLNQLRSARDRLPIRADNDIPCSHTSPFCRPVRHHGLHECPVASALSLLGAQFAQHDAEHSPRRRSRWLRSRGCMNEKSAGDKDEANKSFQIDLEEQVG
jgi:hypothetical protein